MFFCLYTLVCPKDGRFPSHIFRLRLRIATDWSLQVSVKSKKRESGRASNALHHLHKKGQSVCRSLPVMAVMLPGMLSLSPSSDHVWDLQGTGGQSSLALPTCAKWTRQWTDKLKAWPNSTSLRIKTYEAQHYHWESKMWLLVQTLIFSMSVEWLCSHCWWPTLCRQSQWRQTSSTVTVLVSSLFSSLHCNDRSNCSSCTGRLQLWQFSLQRPTLAEVHFLYWKLGDKQIN